MLQSIDLSKVLFFDIECVSAEPHYEALSDEFQDLWRRKAQNLSRATEPLDDERVAEMYRERAAIYAEFGKIVCISVGLVVRDRDTGRLHLRIKSFADADERKVLQGFSDLVNQYFNDINKHYFCGHNIKEFDVPYICRRMVVHQMELPRPFRLRGLKPWETGHLLDTMELWKFGDRKAFTSLRLLTALFGIPSPKDDIDGSEVGRVFHEEQDVERIARYCEKDVLATVQLFLRYRYEPLLEPDQVTFVDVD